MQGCLHLGMADALYKRLQPYVRAHVVIALRSWPNGRIGALDADDLTNEILAMFLGDDGRELKKWDASRGSLENYVCLFARHRIIDFERKELRRIELAGRPVSLDETTEPTEPERPDELAEARDQALAIAACVRAAYPSPLAGTMIELLLVWQVSTTEAARRTNRTRAQIFRWRSRLMAQARSCWMTLFGERGTP